MQKIKTIFERNWEGNRGVIDKNIIEIPSSAIATEKVDGTNVRLTVRNHVLVRLEKRRNPTKLEKAKGITEPWYVDADEYDPQDKWLYDAVKSINLDDIEDGEWSAEAFGRNIQGNPFNWDSNHIFIFSHMPTLKKHVFTNVPTTFIELKEWLLKQKSTFNPERGIEGIVWWNHSQPFGKIKLKDFK